MTYIEKLRLLNYRVYKERTFDFSQYINIIYGKNGIGKTNILESISLLSQGKGILSATPDEILTKGEKNGWSIFANISGHPIIDELMVYIEEDKKKTKINGNVIRGQQELNEIFNIIYLTPQMQNFFNDDKSVRRKFLDRCVYLVEKEQAKLVAKYEYYVKERIKVLLGQWDANWLNVLETKIAESGIEIAKNRNKIIEIMNGLIDKYNFDFPKFILSVDGGIWTDIEKFKEILQQNRSKDRETKRTNDGVHKADLKVFYETKGNFAEFCSTGEQKLLLISLTLLKVFMCLELKKATPIILLDEVFSYLDSGKKVALFNELKKLKVQTFITATDIEVFKDVMGEEKCIKLD